MKVSRPLSVKLPRYGVLFAASAHTDAFRMAERADLFHKLLYVLEGETVYRESNKSLSVRADAGTMIVVPRRVRHEIADTRPTTLLLLCLTQEFLESDPDLPNVWRELSRAPARHLTLSRPARARIEHAWQRAMLESTHARIGGGVTARTLAAQILVQLARLPAAGPRDDARRRIAAVTRELEETFFDEWDLDRAAARAGLSRRRFSDLFRAANGHTFGERLNDLRLTHAARLLREGGHSITGVMFSCGFNDVTHFYRLFRARYGAPPRTWAVQTSISRTSPKAD
jgi:Transcriptional regulator containing an amidase domain and an AraC-type DNA-binding HTH domain